MIAVRQGKHDELGACVGRLPSYRCGERLRRVINRKLWCRVKVDARVNEAEDRHRAVRGELAGQVSAEDADSSIVLVQPLVFAARNDRISLCFADAQVAAADHLIDLLVPDPQIVNGRACRCDRHRPRLGRRVTS